MFNRVIKNRTSSLEINFLGEGEREEHCFQLKIGAENLKMPKPGKLKEVLKGRQL